MRVAYYCKRHLSRGNKMINIKGSVGLAKRAVNRIVIATAVPRASLVQLFSR